MIFLPMISFKQFWPDLALTLLLGVVFAFNVVFLQSWLLTLFKCRESEEEAEDSFGGIDEEKGDYMYKRFEMGETAH